MRNMRWFWGVVTLLALTVGTGAFLYVTGDPGHYDPIFRAKYTAHLGTIVLHGVTSVMALVLGPWQFIGSLRRKHPRWHRVLGYLYLIGVVLGGLTGIPMAMMAEGGPMARVGFMVVAFLWLAVAYQALATALRRNFKAHRAWMLRSYALTFGAVLLRLFLSAFQVLGHDFTDVYPYTPWLSWLTSLAVAEFILGGETYVSVRTVPTGSRTNG